MPQSQFISNAIVGVDWSRVSTPICEKTQILKKKTNKKLRVEKLKFGQKSKCDKTLIVYKLIFNFKENSSTTGQLREMYTGQPFGIHQLVFFIN